MKILISTFLLVLTSCSSAQLDSTYITEKDVIYFEPDSNVQLKLDLYRRKSTEKLPVVLIVHGGGWTKRTRSDMDEIAFAAAQRGYAAVNVSYRLAPKYRFPEQIRDLRAALRWIDANASKYNLDTQKVAGWGYSAGAHLVSLLGLAQNLEKTPQDKIQLKVIVAGGTPADLTKYEDSSLVVKFMGGKYSEMPERYRLASPIYHVDPKDPAVFLYHGANDWIVEYEQMTAFEEKLKSTGVKVESHTVSTIGHVAVFLFSGESLEKSFQFLNQNLESKL